VLCKSIREFAKSSSNFGGVQLVLKKGMDIWMLVNEADVNAADQNGEAVLLHAVKNRMVWSTVRYCYSKAYL